MPNKQAFREIITQHSLYRDIIYILFLNLITFLLLKARHHLAFFMIVIGCASLLFFSSELLLPEAIKKLVFRSPQIDTIGHFICFFILSWVVCSILKLSLLRTFITLTFYAALSELGQYYLGFRRAEFSDFFADVAGISLYIFLKYSHLRYKLFTLKRIIKAKESASVKVNQ